MTHAEFVRPVLRAPRRDARVATDTLGLTPGRAEFLLALRRCGRMTLGRFGWVPPGGAVPLAGTIRQRAFHAETGRRLVDMGLVEPNFVNGCTLVLTAQGRRIADRIAAAEPQEAPQ